MILLRQAALIDPKTRHTMQVVGELSSQVSDLDAKLRQLEARSTDTRRDPCSFAVKGSTESSSPSSS